MAAAQPAAVQPAAVQLAAAQPSAQSLALQKIQNVMTGTFDTSAWQKVEGFAHSKAREWRSAQLKRTSGNTTTTSTPSSARRIVHVKRRKQHT
jgi:hypothetical protein